MGTNHGGVNFGRRSPPIGGQFSTLNNIRLREASQDTSRYLFNPADARSAGRGFGGTRPAARTPGAGGAGLSRPSPAISNA